MNTDNSAYDILVDSDAFVGLLYEKDAHHQGVSELLTQIEKQHKILVTTSYVVAEAATVLSHRKGQAAAREFLKVVNSIPTIFISEELHQESLELFTEREERGTSVVDCSNVVVMRKFDIPKILSFDGFYFKKMDLEAA
jgi:predicted nucleic acid-binding protein